MASEKILIVEDEKDIIDLISYNLKRDGFTVLVAESGEEGLTAARENKPDLILLDIMLPGIDGLQVCNLLKSREATRDIPIIMLTARGEESDIVTGLDFGADDYITKPFSPRVFLARVKAALRRKTEVVGQDDNVLVIGELSIDPARHEVKAAREPVDLTVTEFRLLHFLASHHGRVYTRNQLVDYVRGDNTIVTDRTIDVHVAGLRKKLGKNAVLIETVRGIGYRFKE